ncbi:hypothetical protein HY384_03320 [Candidatus Daviesbacteria bacterium]|nr:hypothetical protein [Candidatus Daviesbacteria bacterium]
MTVEVSVPEVELNPTEGLVKFRGIINKYNQITTQNPTSFDQSRIVSLFASFGLDPHSIVKPVSTYEISPREIVIRSDALGRVIEGLEKKIVTQKKADEYKHNHFFLSPEEQKSVEIETAKPPQQKLEESLSELENVNNLFAYIKTNLSTIKNSEQVYQRLIEKMNQLAGDYQGLAIRSVIEMGMECLTEDALRSADLPLPDQVQKDSNSRRPNETYEAIRQLAVSVVDPTLKNQYETMISSVSDNISGFSGDQSWVHASALKTFNDRFKQDEWQRIEATPEQVKKLYDLTQVYLFNILYEGRHESWTGTAAANIFYSFHDPRALPGLLTHLKMFGFGHTSNIVGNTIMEIIDHPLTPEGLREVTESTTPLYRRIINDWFVSPNPTTAEAVKRAFKMGMGGYALASYVQEAEKHLVYSQLLGIADHIAQAKKDPEVDAILSSDAIIGFFAGNFDEWTGAEAINDLLLRNLAEVAPVIAKSKISDWRLNSPKIFAALVNPPDGRYSEFPKLIAQEGLGLGQEYLEKLDILYKSGDLRRGVMSRYSFAEGLLFMSSKESGPEVLKSILDTSQGANRDAERIRSIFQLLNTLDSFGSFEFSPKPTLSEIITDLRDNKLVNAAKERMQLSDAEVPALQERLSQLMESGIFQIIPHLLAKYEEQGKTAVAAVTREIGQHIVLGDFISWRNGLETSMAQLSIIPEEKRQIWLTPVIPVELKLGMNTDREARQGAVETIQRIAREAKAHILEVYKIEFTPQRIQFLEQQSKQLAEKLKKDQLSHAERSELGQRKRTLDNEAKVIQGILNLENLDPQSFDPVILMEAVSRVTSSLSTFQGFDQPIQDLGQISEVMTTQQQLRTVSTIRAIDTDDPLDLLKVGIEPRETCQSYRNGSHNYCLPAYVVDANKRAVNVVNENGEVLARSIIKLTHRKNGDQTIPTILFEPIYATSTMAPIYRALVRVVLEKAKGTQVDIILANEINANSGTDNLTAIPILQQEAQSTGMLVTQEDAEVFLPQSHNTYEYSDTLGGDITYFETYRSIKQATIIKSI